jgi:signal transduction histidine kinase
VNISLAQTVGFAELKMDNTGAGVPLELHPRAFVRFFRGDSSHSSAVEGGGLGLSIAQSIITARGGTFQSPFKITLRCHEIVKSRECNAFSLNTKEKRTESRQIIL